MATTLSQATDASQLQEVLTRYVDSRDGYLQASKLVPQPGLAESFELIALRRDLIANKVAEMIEAQGFRPDVGGSPEAGVHRWWIRLRDKMTTQEADAILAECVRGEHELQRTLQAAIQEDHLTPEHRELISDAVAEVNLAIRAFESAIGE